MGTMFLVVRLADAFVDPCIGALVDRTRTKHGRFRPWLMWFAIRLASVVSLPFMFGCRPHGEDRLCLCHLHDFSFINSAVNVPYCAMPGALTLDPRERHSLQSWRFACAFIGGLVVTVIGLPLVDLLGQGDKAKGYLFAMGFMGFLGVVLIYCCFFMTRERYLPAA